MTFNVLGHWSHECLMSLIGFRCAAWEFPAKRLWLYGRRGYQVCMKMQLSWMVKANEYKRPVNLVMIAIN